MTELHVDGYLMGRGNPAIAGGWLVVSETNQLLIHGMSHTPVTNNEMELRAVRDGVMVADVEFVIVSDSQTVLAWLHRGQTRFRGELNEMIAEINLIKHHKRLQIVWRWREVNLAGKMIEHGDVKRRHQRILDELRYHA